LGSALYWKEAADVDRSLHGRPHPSGLAVPIDGGSGS
jgi:hypothetical protein